MPRSGSAPTTEACASFLDSLPGLLKPSDPCGRLGSGRTIVTGSERVNELKPLAQQWVRRVIAGRSEHPVKRERVTRDRRLCNAHPTSAKRLKQPYCNRCEHQRREKVRDADPLHVRSEERRVGKECRSRWS